MIKVSQLSLEEKIKILSGKSGQTVAEKYGNRFPVMKDGPHGVSNRGVCYPNMCLSACSWDKQLIYSMGASIGNDCIKEGVDVILGPSVNIKRNPLCGRNFEYFSEDLCLSALLGSAYINGVQSTGTSACVKHYCCYNQETNRFSQNVYVDQDVLMDLYARVFKIIIAKSSPDFLMTSYNLVGGEFVSQSSYLLKEVLRDLLGYDGVIITDWGGIDYRYKVHQAGVNINMPGDFDKSWKEIKDKVDSGVISEQAINESVERVLKAIAKTNGEKKTVEISEADIESLTTDGMVLLKNDGILPLSSGEDFAVVGALAENPVFQGGGCAEIKGEKINTPYNELCIRSNKKLDFAQGYSLFSESNSDKYLEQVYEVCANHDTVLFFAGALSCMESEGYDRENIKISNNQLEALKRLKLMGKKVVTIVTNGSVLELKEVEKYSDAILECWYAGDKFAKALCVILFGKVNPSGRLAESFPYELKDYIPSENYIDAKGCVRYREGVNVGYKYYLSKGIKTLYPFGFGLSYTSFEYSNMTIENSSDGGINVSVLVKNTGAMAGKTVVQVYLTHETDNARSLSGFEKVSLASNETKCVTVKVDAEFFKRFNPKRNGYAVLNGSYTVQVCSDAETPLLTKNYYVGGKFVCDRYTTLKELRMAKNGPEIISKYFSECIGRAVVGKDNYKAKFIGNELDDSSFVKNVVDSTPIHLFTSLTFGFYDNIELEELLKKINEELIDDE